jgi:GTPase
MVRAKKADAAAPVADAQAAEESTPRAQELLPIVAIVGRPNVGKSTLYNALTNTRDAIVSDMAGVTRDRRYGACRDFERAFLLVDTGGIGEPNSMLEQYIGRQARVAMKEADLIVLLLDARAGVMPDDRALAIELRKSGKASLLVVNKSDGLDPHQVSAEFSELGLGAPLLIAAAHRRGVVDLAEHIVEALPPVRLAELAPGDEKRIRVAIVGRPNAGKSTLVNRLLGEERVLAFDEPGTTRDAIEVQVERDGVALTLIDTAGIRRRARVSEALEKFSVIKALQSIESAQVAVVMLDAQAGITEQDVTVVGHVLQSGRALILAMNKWDGLERHQRTQVESEMDRRLDFVPWAIRTPISALHGSGLGELMKAIKRSHASATKAINTNELTEAVHKAFEAFQPPIVQGRTAKLRYAHQGGRNPPRIIIHGTRLTSLPDSYRRYLENTLRERFKLKGAPVLIEFREGKNPFAGQKNELTDRQIERKRRLIRHVKR